MTTQDEVQELRDEVQKLRDELKFVRDEQLTPLYVSIATFGTMLGLYDKPVRLGGLTDPLRTNGDTVAMRFAIELREWLKRG